MGGAAASIGVPITKGEAAEAQEAATKDSKDREDDIPERWKRTGRCRLDMVFYVSVLPVSAAGCATAIRRSLQVVF